MTSLSSFWFLFLVSRFFLSVLTLVGFAKELHAHDGEDEDDDTEHEGEVAQGAYCLAHDGDE